MNIIGIGKMTPQELQAEVDRGGRFIVYQYCFSVLIMTFKRPSDIFFVRGNESRFMKGLPYALLSFLVGWWGIPWGPIYTVQSLATDLTGGQDVTGEVLASLIPEPPKMVQQPPPLPGASPVPPVIQAPPAFVYRAPAPEKNTRKRVFYIVLGVVLAILLLPCFGLFGLGLMALHNSKQWEQRAQVTVPPYEDLVGEGLQGAGFHFQWGTNRYIGCSLHQFDGKMPSEMVSLSIKDHVKITGCVHKQKDVQVLTYESSELDKRQPLVFREDVSVKAGDPVLLLFDDAQVRGRISSRKSSQRSEVVFFRVTDRFKAAGCSGAPVVSATTATVIGVALTVDDPDNARYIGFELLKLPANLKGE